MQKVGRNDPCPCGSGKKYKKCCEAKDAVPKPIAAHKIEGSALHHKAANLTSLFKQAHATPTPIQETPPEEKPPENPENPPSEQSS